MKGTYEKLSNRAGVGRTGTYICLEICLQQLVQTKQLDILKVVSSLRRQRISMVQTPVNMYQILLSLYLYSLQIFCSYNIDSYTLLFSKN